jgi:deazaflavin-dependent oxidoreductase (nitroreductase family)
MPTLESLPLIEVVGTARAGLAMEKATTLTTRLARIAHNATLKLTHYGRKTGQPYEVLIWFIVEGETIYLATLNKDRQWCRNVRVNPQVSLRIGRETFDGEVEALTGSVEKAQVAELVKSKYWYARPFICFMKMIGREAISAAFRVTLVPSDIVA